MSPSPSPDEAFARLMLTVALAQILVPPGKQHAALETFFPADFPATSTRKRSEVPDHGLPAQLVHRCLGSSEGGTEDEVTSRGMFRKKQRETSSLSMMSSASQPRRQPLAPPKGLLPQQDAGFARFLKEVASPTHKRVTAGGRIVSAEHPPRLYGRNKKSSETSWARVPYSHITTDLPQGTNDTFVSFPNGSYYWGPNGELYVRPAPEALFPTMYPGAQPPLLSVPVGDGQQYQLPVVGNAGAVQLPMAFNADPQHPGQQVPMSGDNMPRVSMPPNPFFVDPLIGAASYRNQYQWSLNDNNTHSAEEGRTRNIRTPRVHFPIGSRFDYEQNQQALRDRLAQLMYEMDNLQYLTHEEAELKRLEKEVVEDQIEQFRQVWELQTYLAGGEDEPMKSPNGQHHGAATMSQDSTTIPSQTRRDNRRPESNEPLPYREAVPEHGQPTIVHSTASNVKPVDRKISMKRAGVKDASTLQRKSESESAVQTPPSMAPIHGKENRKSTSASQASEATLPTIPGSGQVSLRHRTAGAALGSQLLRKNATSSVESLQIHVDTDVGSSDMQASSDVPNGLSVEGYPRVHEDEVSTLPKKTRRELQRSVEQLRLSAGLPTNAVEASRIPVKRFAFAQQLRKIAAISKSFFGDASSCSPEAVKADNSNPTHPPHSMHHGKASCNRDITTVEARDGTGFTVISALLPQVDGVSATVSNNEESQKRKQEKARSVAAV